MPSKYVYYYRCPQHRNNYVLSFAFAFDREDDVYQFAFSYPYSYSRLQKYLELRQTQFPEIFKRETIGQSVQERRLEFVTIKEEVPEAEARSQRKLVFVTARVHPGESPASYVCQGLMDYLVSNTPIARCLRRNLVFKFIPMLNPDGVFVGNYRTSLLGADLNRCWQDPSPLAHPTLHATKKLLETLASNKEDDLSLYLDLHAHTGLLGTFVYGNSYDDVYRFEHHALFPKHLSNCAEDFSSESTVYNRDPGKSGTSRRSLTSLLPDKVNCYTLEVSFYGYPKHGSAKNIIPYLEEDYLRLGESICRAILDYYNATGFIPSSDMPAGTSAAASSRGEKNKGKRESRLGTRVPPGSHYSSKRLPQGRAKMPSSSTSTRSTARANSNN
ncbi:cytosolic carboxypeptidase 6-like [Limulus polyphemus]|uniref:Cytosolic carboxypeptidase 6-like n=1 Tax=Limulus polyphemus TaxID=6850 RepID=A0ABM1B785_LIMPO|nr:cytosolic carboxypeptidase 6-like [Limulus polyphemus]